MTTNTHKLSFKEKLGYGMGDGASNLFWQNFVFFLAIFYTDVFGLAPAAVGTMLFVTRIFDMFSDPIMGAIADRTRSRWGRFRPYILFGAIPFGIMGVLTFTTPDLSPNGKLIYAYVTYTLVVLMYTVVNIPYSALMGVISPSTEERTKAASFKFVLAFGAGLLIQVMTAPMVAFFGQGDDARGYQMTMVVYAILAVILLYFTFSTTRERVTTPQASSSRLGDDFTDLLKNKPWVILFFMSLFVMTFTAIRNGTTAYYFNYVVEDASLMPWFFALGSIAMIIGVMATKKMIEVFGSKKRLYMFTMGLNGILMLLFFFIPPENIVLMFTVNTIIGLASGPGAPLLWAMFADTADYSEYKTGRRATALVFSAALFAIKMGFAIGGGLIGWLLAFYGYQANVTQTAEAVTGIMILMAIIPGICGILAAVLVKFYELDDKRVAEIEAELAERKAATA